MRFEPLRLAASRDALSFFPALNVYNTHYAFSETRDPRAFEVFVSECYHIDGSQVDSDPCQFFFSRSINYGNAVRSKIRNQELAFVLSHRDTLGNFAYTNILNLAASVCINQRNVLVFFIRNPRIVPTVGKSDVRRSASGRNLARNAPGMSIKDGDNAGSFI